MFDKDALNKLNSLKSELSTDKPKRKTEFKSVIPLIDEEFSRNKDFVKKKKTAGESKRLIKELFLKAGNPTVDQAVKRMRSEIPEARQLGYKVVRVVHGYGSTGTGGALKQAVVDPLQWMINEGVIESVIPGEQFNCFCDDAVSLVNEHPVLKKDHDYRYENPGITLVIL